ncbi:MAG: hypothetical protein EOP90_10910 [Lysobacteraceae bacterium]|nr:MAG: hypothetical protein EOP90_10910 [Xanthomonadaceae bacterium]
MRKLLLGLGIAAACLPTAALAGVIDRAGNGSSQGTQTWSAWGGEVGVRWNHDLLGNLGIAVDAERDQMLPTTDRRQHEWFGLRESGGLDFLVRYGALERFSGGSLQMRGGYMLRLPDGSRLDLRNLTMRVRANEPGILDVVGADGRAWFYIDRVMFELVDNRQTLAVKASDLRMSAAFARRIGQPQAAGWIVADFAVDAGVFVQGGDAVAGTCSPYPWPGVAVPEAPGQTYQADLFMQGFSVSPVGCQNCDGPSGGDGTIAWAPSSTLKNNVNSGSQQQTIGGDPLGTSSALYTANIRWQQMFTGNVPPYNNDQHPYLIWNLYRFNADGSFEQIGRSSVKHAWLTTNGNCADSCRDSHSLGRSCTDTYGTGNNDAPGDLGPRSEIIPATGQWGRCGSIWDPDCNGVENGNGNDSWTRRMKVPESQVSATANPGATYLMDSWYVARDDINIYNSMATVTGTPVYSSGNWTFSGQANYKLGAAIDRWVNPASPGPNAMNTEIVAPEGHAKVAVKVTDLGGGSWRYEYAVMNFDFARAVTTGSEPNLRVLSNKGFDTFSVPLPAGATASATAFRDGDANATTDWRTSTTGGRVQWTANGRSASWNAREQRPTLDWGSLYSFGFVSNRAPVAGQARLNVAQAGTPAAFEVATLVPGN